MLDPAASLPSRPLWAEEARWSVERAWPVPGQPQVLAVEVTAAEDLESAGFSGAAASGTGSPAGGSSGAAASGSAALSSGGARRARRAGYYRVEHQGGAARPGEHLELFPPNTDPALPALQQAARGGLVIAHEPGLRAVVWHRDEANETYTVVLPAGGASELLAGMRRAQAFSGPFRLPRLISHGDSTATFQALTGVSLHRPHRIGAQAWETAWEQSLDAWSTAIQHPGELPVSTPVHGAATEIRRLQRWEALVRPYIVGSENFQRNVRTACEALASIPERRMVPAHRQLRDEDLLYSPEVGPALVKVSSAGWAHPALDLGGLRACAKWNELRGLWDAPRRAVVFRLINDAAYRNGVAADALEAYERAALLRLSAQFTLSPKLADAAESLRASLLQPEPRG
ncbi:hypothetical protein I2485_01060 [Nesterenkonia sp. E16_7]|uniref:hypothetical protein n=1 Tax=unclassified Nesterenkonia TaxID=2629769 RepID=UPI001A930C8F|nr:MULTISPECIES: hypothetical protein [unclassified Nesterenkonia]MBO0596565.1 hypothetical protein [Nesterenkonia sp. E16_10]MBO0597236.1 hypothetical protein [Nesterenkonia sp. E16_7]